MELRFSMKSVTSRTSANRFEVWDYRTKFGIFLLFLFLEG